MAQFRSVLVANRGEIVSRIARTAHTMGIEVVAVYAPDDADSPHVLAADRAVRLAGESLASTYLDADKLIQAARAAGAEAIHPGYGLLAEDHRFAAAVMEAGLTFIGPSPEAIRRMGLKDSAKQFARETGLPVLPEAALAGDDPADWLDAAETVGYPVIVKATAGGGGRAMHVVERPEDLAAAVRTARREAAALFGRPDVFVEHYLASPRHVEVQVAGDRFGTAVHLFERECSIQRRHQKVVEEAPSPTLSAPLLARMYAASVELTRALGYVGVGTVEYLVDDEQERFFFLEMNTRIQVEHPVTEAVTGVDLVRLQLELAMGRPLPFAQESLIVTGHAIEARVYAERPEDGFAPSVGQVLRYDHPEAAGVRYEDGVASNTTLSPFYDPMLGKVIAHAATRDEAAARLTAALQRMRIHGIATNRDFLVSVVAHPDFAAGATHTDFVDAHPDLLKREGEGPNLRHLAALVAVTALRRLHRAATPVARPGIRPLPAIWSPPTLVDQVDPVGHALTVVYRFEEDATGWRLRLRIDGQEHVLGIRGLDGTSVRVEQTGVEVRCEVWEYDDDRAWVNDHRSQSGWCFRTARRDDSAAPASGEVVSSLPGTVVAAVAAGQRVAAGDEVAVIEAMKLEHPLLAPRAGRVVESREVGAFVRAGEVVVRIDD